MNTSIPQTFVNEVIDSKLGKDDVDKRVNSKCQALIRRIDNKETVVGLLVDQSAVWVGVHDRSISGVDAVTCLEVRASLNKFPDFFHVGTFIDGTHMKL